MSDSFRISKFDPTTSKPHSTWLIIGARNSGKSVLLMDLIYQTRKNYDTGLAMTATDSTAKALRKIFPSSMVYSKGYDYDRAAKFLDSAKELAEREKKRNFLLVLDDCAFDGKIMKSDTQRELHLNGRHSKICMFSTTQYLLTCTPLVRGNIDYVCALQDNNLSSRKKLYEYFFGVFQSFSEFESVFLSVTKDYTALVLDNTQKKGGISQSVFWYKANDKTPASYRLLKSAYYTFENHAKRLLENKKKKGVDAESKVVTVRK